MTSSLLLGPVFLFCPSVPYAPYVPVMSNADRHEAIKINSQRLLQAARDALRKKSGYDSRATRLEMKTCFSDRSSLEPYDWQLDVAEALLLGLDSIVIAGTGSGKTIPFMLPLLIHPEKMILILSPLKVLQRDQVQSS
jgi:ATP-dependent helicase YprA (DUF1998 family)